MYDTTNKRIMVSRDVTFFENVIGNMNNNNQTNIGNTGIGNNVSNDVNIHSNIDYNVSNCCWYIVRLKHFLCLLCYCLLAYSVYLFVCLFISFIWNYSKSEYPILFLHTQLTNSYGDITSYLFIPITHKLVFTIIYKEGTNHVK